MKKIYLQYRGIAYIILLAIVVLSYLVSDYSKTSVGKDLASKMQKQLQDDEVLLYEVMTDLQEVLLISGDAAYQKKSLEYQNKYKDRFAFFLFNNHQLELWTDNHIPFPKEESSLSNIKLQHLGSYKVLVHAKPFNQFTLYGLQIIKISYPWENAYLVNHIAPYFKIFSDINISDEDGFEVLDSSGNVLFFLQLSNPQTSNKIQILPFFSFIISFFLLALVLTIVLRKLQEKKPLFSLMIFAVSMFLWYGLHWYLGVPENLFQSRLFSSGLYANNWIQNSLGNLLFLSLSALLVVIWYFTNFKKRQISWPWTYIYLLIIYALFLGIFLLIKSLVFDSQITLNLYQLASLDIYSYVVLWIIFMILISWFLLVFRWLGHLSKSKKTEFHFWVVLLIFGIIPLLNPSTNIFVFWLIQAISSLFLVAVYYFHRRKASNRKAFEFILYLIFFTFITTWYINDLVQEKENQFRKNSALTLDLENDPFLEAHFLSCVEQIQKNKVIQKVLSRDELVNSDDSLLLFITEKYFADFKPLYNINLIHCEPQSLILIQPDNVETPCYDYFQDRISKAQTIIAPDTFYLINGSFQYRHYIGKIPLKTDSLHTSNIFIEFVSKGKPKEMGLPAILEKVHINHQNIFRNYSYAIYDNGVLKEWFGKCDYKQKLSDYRLDSYHEAFFNLDGFKHYIYSKNAENVLIISLEIPGTLQRLASFAFVFLFFSFLAFFMYAIFFTDSLQYSVSSFQGRLQYSMIVLLLFSFILIGVSTLYYIMFLNKTKNADNLMEKAHSVLIELEHKIMGIEDFNQDEKIYVESLLIKFSEVFFTDITLYNNDGELLASSRPEMFSASLLSERMDANAFYQLSVLKNSYLIQDEKIGTQNFQSAYLPFQNQDNQSVAFLNLPYFAKQFELEEEVSGFVVAFLNIYLFLLFITIVISIIISRFLSKPIQLIKNKIRHLDLQQTNEKIEWNKDDEIGDLVREYNRMVDELSVSATQLAMSQRESAWREMAQQIAHEIKNPLTPMKLNVQYLQKAWDDQVDDYEDRMKRITKGLQEQIDVLSNIAGQFSTFAAIDKISPEKLNLRTIIEDVVAIFKGNAHINFHTSFSLQEYLIVADKNQMIRVFNNIYKNAVQAIGNQENASIITKVSVENSELVVSISDNGCGISPSEIPHIFEPRFTTKSGGMGLGLSLVKKMLENMDARITVKSELGEGSQFELSFPLISGK